MYKNAPRTPGIPLEKPLLGEIRWELRKLSNEELIANAHAKPLLRNEYVIEFQYRGYTRQQIANHMSLTVGQVAGIISRRNEKYNRESSRKRLSRGA